MGFANYAVDLIWTDDNQVYAKPLLFGGLAVRTCYRSLQTVPRGGVEGKMSGIDTLSRVDVCVR